MQRIYYLLIALSLSSLIACGSTDSQVISGTAATGLAISGGVVTANCNNGSTSTITGSDGTYSFTLPSGSTTPCLLRVVSGSTNMYSALISGQTIANITPFTHLIVANALGFDPSRAFDDAATGSVSTMINADNINAAQAVIMSALNGIGLSLPQGMTPLTSPFIAATGSQIGDDLDKSIDSFMFSINSAGMKISDMATMLQTANAVNAGSIMQTLTNSTTPSFAPPITSPLDPTTTSTSTSTPTLNTPTTGSTSTVNSSGTSIAYTTVPSNALRVSLAGNAYITKQVGTEDVTYNDPPTATSTGIIPATISNWTSPNTVISAYVYVSNPGRLEIGVGGNWSATPSSAVVNVTAQGLTFPITVSSANTGPVAAGAVNIGAAGYVKIDLQGVSKLNTRFPDITALYLSGTSAQGLVSAQTQDPSLGFYWIRRGPSTHMAYYVPSSTTYFYNEVTIPQGLDPVGSYFMVNGFSTGYMGIQVKSASTRWVLFSVWDPSSCNKSVSSTCTSLESSGANVSAASFGGEGTGGQSYMVFPWVAGNTYKFITRASISGTDTLYSSWFYAPETNKWYYMATFRYPGSQLKLTGVHSFNECFLYANSYLPKKMILTNQWASADGASWSEVTGSSAQPKAFFDSDGTGKSGQRLDFAGGLADSPAGGTNNAYFLADGGFFNNDGSFNAALSTQMNVKSNVWFSRQPSGGGVTSSSLSTIVQNLPTQ